MGAIVQVMSYGASAESAATTTIFTRMLQHSLKDSRGLSQHPAATGAPHLSSSHAVTAQLEVVLAHSQKRAFFVATELKWTVPTSE